ncbi:unnamed protein product [Rotaria magnacalcarata]|uniref:Uncharacterized protein n=1 Tax=Rotaria magnacalcarata TaxID=392030 RepID=A0A816W5X5_9BILA|nr:unnamed protein product [Rotaria magnacalcarata]CAF3991205.1 unnamed protein product [Rotaria magnacalcarata]
MFVLSKSFIIVSALLIVIYLENIVVQTQSLTGKGKFDFGPNQLASNVWYKPKGQLINGHYENSYSNVSLWSNLELHLRNNNGSILIQASEIGFMKNEALMAFRNSNIPVIAVLPGFTQCYDGNVLALLELYGQSPKENLFCTVFNICNSTERQDPNGKGWFVTQDNFSYTPDLLNFDERIPNLIPYLDYNKLMNTSINPPQWLYSNLSWTDRKMKARIDVCPQAGSDRIKNLMNDYIKYLSVVNEKFNSTKIPRIQINWNVIEGWEWRDEHCLDLLYEKFNNATDFDYAYRYVTNPCHQDSQHLNDLIELLCSVGRCPEVVFMDVDLTYITSYSLEVLHMNKQILKTLQIPFGISLVDQCAEIDNCIVEIVSSENPKVILNLDAKSKYPNLNRNQMQEFSLLNVLNFLINQSIVDDDTHIAMTSWTTWPIEIGQDIVESKSGSMAHTANQIFEKILIPNSFAR